MLVDKNETLYFGDKLHDLRVKNLDSIKIADLNKNSMRNKFTCLVEGVIIDITLTA